ncbi:FlhC family transcriptional regulator [Cupriavidus necator]|uniref:FlhC family transcriptional regulator n=1 Tax=Cupriavidus necator TaxID=106590 RepID=UPI0039C08BE5
MKLNIMRGDFDKVGLAKLSAERIRSTNYHLTDYMEEALIRHAAFASTFGIRKEEIESLRKNEPAFRMLMGMPFMTVVPTINSVEDWKSIVSGRTTTVAVDKIRQQTPALDSVDKILLYHNNRAYVWLMVELLHASILAAPLLGISLELAEYLRYLPQHHLDLAVSRIQFPIFRWRIAEPVFFIEHGADRTSYDLLAHYFMRFSQIDLGKQEGKQEWTRLRLDRLQTDVYGRLLTGMGCRASSVASLLSINPAKARKLYLEQQGESSPCGQMPSSVAWHFESSSARVQSTVFLWLYRVCANTGANVPEALIAAYDVVAQTFGSDLRLTADRATYLARTMAEESELSLAACRACGTDYLIANSAPRIELSRSYACPACSGTLSSSPWRRRQRGGESG